MNERQFLKRLNAALERVNEEIGGHAARGKIASGLSAEGYVGGYRDALMDVEAMLLHGYPTDLRGYWRGRG